MTANGRIARAQLLPSLGIAFASATWGVYWIPLRHIDGLGLPATWATCIMVALALVALTPFQILRWRRLLGGGWIAVVAGLLAGTSFIFYSNAYALTTILNVLLLFYLTPIWSTLMARVFLGEAITPLRIGAIVAAFVGLGIMLGGHGDWPVPRNVGDWMSLSAGMIWSAATVVLRKHQGPDARAVPAGEAPGALENTFLFFSGGLIGALILPFLLLPDATGALPPVGNAGPYLPWIVGMALLWWVPSQIALMWGVPKVSPGRVGILLMAEVVFGAISAALFSDEPFGLRQIAGGSLILGAAVADTLINPKPAEPAGQAQRRPDPTRAEGTRDVSLGRLQP